MSKHRNKNALRMQIAYEAARILTDQGGHSYQSARIKAANRLGLNRANLLPGNAEIQLALAENQRLFQSDTHPHILKNLRQIAKEAMQAFSEFRPRLVGGVMDGTATKESDIQLYLFAETAEAILFKLRDLNIPWQEEEKSLLYTHHLRKTHPVFLIHADNTGIRLIVLPLKAERQPPLSRVTMRPELGISITMLKQIPDQPDNKK